MGSKVSNAAAALTRILLVSGPLLTWGACGKGPDTCTNPASVEERSAEITRNSENAQVFDQCLAGGNCRPLCDLFFAGLHLQNGPVRVEECSRDLDAGAGAQDGGGDVISVKARVAFYPKCRT